MSYYSVVAYNKQAQKGFNFVTIQTDKLTEDFSSTSTTWVVITGLGFTKANYVNGKYAGQFSASIQHGTTNGTTFIRVVDDGVAFEGQRGNVGSGTGSGQQMSCIIVGDSDGTDITCETQTLAGTLRLDATNEANRSVRIQIIEVEPTLRGELTTTEDNITSNFATSTTSFVDITGLTMTKPSHSSAPSVGFGMAQICYQTSLASMETRFRLNDNGTTSEGKASQVGSTTTIQTLSMIMGVTPDGTTFKAEGKVVSGTATFQGASADARCTIKLLSLSGSAGQLTIKEVNITADFTTTSGSYVDVTDLTLTRGDIPVGRCFAIACQTVAHSVSAQLPYTRIVDDTTGLGAHASHRFGSNTERSHDHGLVGNTDGKVIKVQARRDTGTTRVHGTDIEKRSKMVLLELAP